MRTTFRLTGGYAKPPDHEDHIPFDGGTVTHPRTGESVDVAELLNDKSELVTDDDALVEVLRGYSPLELVRVEEVGPGALSKRRKDELVALANERGIETEGLTRDEVLDRLQGEGVTV